MYILFSKMSKSLQRIILLSLGLTWAFHFVTAHPSEPPDFRTGTAETLDQSIIQLDGKLEEKDWQDAPVLTNFVQNSPNEGARRWIICW